MAQWDESIVDVRNCKTMRVMVAVDPEVVQLVESRGDLQFLWSQMGYNRVRCRASGHVVPVKLSALSQYINGAHYRGLLAAEARNTSWVNYLSERGPAPRDTGPEAGNAGPAPRDTGPEAGNTGPAPQDTGPGLQPVPPGPVQPEQVGRFVSGVLGVL
eukprot:14499174-Alexandrium_andersonii.AAC.1